MRPLAFVLLIFSALVLAGCAPAFESRPSESVIGGEGRGPGEAEANRAALEVLRERAREAVEEGAAAETGDLPAVSLEPAPSSASAGAVLQRDEVEAFIARGPHALLGVVELAPYREGDQAIGFELLTFRPGAGFLLAGGFMPGDVVRRVNDRTVLMPDAFVEIWGELAVRDTLTVDLLRDGEELTFEWEIRDAPAGD